MSSVSSRKNGINETVGRRSVKPSTTKAKVTPERSDPTINPILLVGVGVAAGFFGLLFIGTVAFFAITYSRKPDAKPTEAIVTSMPAIPTVGPVKPQLVEMPIETAKPVVQAAAAVARPTQSTKPVETVADQQSTQPTTSADSDARKPSVTVQVVVQPSTQPEPKTQAESRPQSTTKPITAKEQEKLTADYSNTMSIISRSPALIEEREKYIDDQKEKLRKLLKNRDSNAQDKTNARNRITFAKNQLDNLKTSFDKAKADYPVLKARLQNAGLLKEEDN